MHVGVVVVERERDLQLVGDRLELRLRVLAPAVHPGLADDAGLPGVRVRVFRIELDRLVQHAQRLGVRFARRPMVQHLAGEHVFVGRHVLGPLALGALVRRRLDAAAQRRDDRRRHLVLDRENVLELAVVALGPDMRLGLAVDQLHGDAHAVAGLAHASLDHVVDAEFARDVLRLHRLALVGEDGVARDDQEVAEARQLGDDVFGQPVGEELLLRVAAHVGEGQHGDRRHARGRLPAARSQRAALRAASPSVRARTRKTRIGRLMFLTLCSPRSSKPTSRRSPTWSRTARRDADAARLRHRLRAAPRRSRRRRRCRRPRRSRRRD